jgi:hypothetical protein
MFDDVQQVKIDGLDAAHWPGAAPVLRMVEVQDARICGFATGSTVQTFLRVEGDRTQSIVLEDNDFTKVTQVVDRASQLPEDAIRCEE